MSDEQTTTGGTTLTPLNPAATAHAPKQAPVMDVVPPPAMANEPAGVPVVDAPPEVAEALPISDDIAEQIAADSTMPPPIENAPVADTANPTSESNAGTPALATPPNENPKAADAKDSPSELIQAEITRDESAPAQPVSKAPKAHNPARAAVIATVFITIALAALAVFAYMSTQS